MRLGRKEILDAISPYVWRKNKDNAMGGNVVPDKTRSYDIGSPSAYIRRLYVDELVGVTRIVDSEQSGKPYATIVVAAAGSSAPQSRNADYVCVGKNDQEKINLAIAAARGGTVLLLEGNYFLSDYIQLQDNVSITGLGRLTKIYARRRGMYGASIENVDISNLSIVGGTDNCVHIISGSAIRIHRCYFSDALGLGIYVTVLHPDGVLSITDNYIYGCVAGGIYVAGVDPES